MIGLSESQLHRIIGGASAKIETIVAIAKAGHVELNWLATGNGPRNAGTRVQQPGDADGARATSGGRVDLDTLRGILRGLAKIEEVEGPLDPDWKARMAVAVYDYLIETWEFNAPRDKSVDIGAALQLIKGGRA